MNMVKHIREAIGLRFFLFVFVFSICSQWCAFCLIFFDYKCTLHIFLQISLQNESNGVRLSLFLRCIPSLRNIFFLLRKKNRLLFTHFQQLCTFVGRHPKWFSSEKKLRYRARFLFDALPQGYDGIFWISNIYFVRCNYTRNECKGNKKYWIENLFGFFFASVRLSILNWVSDASFGKHFTSFHTSSAFIPESRKWTEKRWFNNTALVWCAKMDSKNGNTPYFTSIWQHNC